MSSTINSDHYDLLSLGSGEAGKYVAWTYRSKIPNSRCAVVEKKWLGGSCPNIACLPSKNFVHSAKVAYQAKHLQEYGLQTVNGAVDMQAVRERKRDMVNGLISMHEGKFKETGVEVIKGNGRFVGEKKIEIELLEGGKKVVTADIVIICTGSRAAVDNNIPGLKAAAPLTHIEILEIDEVPSHLIIMGAGYIGLEFAQVMQRLGSKVSVIERNNRILGREDEDVSSALRDILSKEGVEFHFSAHVTQVHGRSGDSVTLEGNQSGMPFKLTGSHLLIAAGRTPNNDEIGLKDVGIATTKAGHVQVDEYLRTSQSNVFAVGDCAGSPQFTHIGFDDFRIVVDQLFGKKARSTTNRQIPYTLFTDPELAHVGLSEAEASAKGIQYRLAKIPMMAFLRTRTLGETTGFAKVLVSKTDDQILGFTALGPSAGELLAPVQLAMANRLPYTSLSGLILTHPTMAEGLVSLFSSVPSL